MCITTMSVVCICMYVHVDKQVVDALIRYLIEIMEMKKRMKIRQRRGYDKVKIYVPLFTDIYIPIERNS